MELTLLHLYPDAMSLYGEYANLSVLRRHLEALGVTVHLEKVTCEDVPDFTRADLVYMGAGTEGAQKAVLLGLPHHADALREALDRGCLLFFTGNAMEILGRSVTDAKGKTWNALGFADFTTVETDKRTPGDVIAASTLWETPTVGFMNKCSTTSGITTPLFSALPLGFGNDTEHGADSPANIPEIIEQIEHTARHKHGSNSGQERGELVMIFCAFDEIFRNEMVEKKQQHIRAHGRD